MSYNRRDVRLPEMQSGFVCIYSSAGLTLNLKQDTSATSTPPSQVDCRTAVDWAITNRRTEKVLSEQPLYPTAEQISELETANQEVLDAVAVAGMAPFHYDRNLNGIPEPWRMQIFFHQSCRSLSSDFPSIVGDVKPGNKLPAMLNACGALVLVNWLPQTSFADESKGEQINREHLAATSAAVQNLLLALQSRGLGTYWSSGGPLGSDAIKENPGITTGPERPQSLIAAVFVDYPFLTAKADVQRLAGKNFVKRTDSQVWSQVIEYKSQ